MATFLHIVTGWVLCRSKPTVTNLVRTIGPSLLGIAAKHWTTYERFFYLSAWSMGDVSRLLLQRVVAPLIEAEGVERVIDLKIDDTTCGRFGKHVAYAGYFKDASASNALKTVIHWSHNWVIGCVAMRGKRWPQWVIGLPAMFALYRKAKDCDAGHPFRTKPQLAAQMIRDAHEALVATATSEQPDWTIRVTADGGYAARQVVEGLPNGVNLVSRMRRDAALYALPPNRRPKRRGRPAKKGKRLPTPAAIAARRKKGWKTVEVRMYGKTVQRRVLSVVCLWPHVCEDRPVQLVIVRDPSDKQNDDYLFCTDATVSEVQIVERFAARWPIEESIQQAKQFDGMEDVQGWCPRTVLRQAPMAMVVQTLVKAWYLLHGVKHRPSQPKGHETCGWAQEKTHPSYLDMLATLRCVLWNDRINHNSAFRRTVRHILHTLRFTLCAAA